MRCRSITRYSRTSFGCSSLPSISLPKRSYMARVCRENIKAWKHESCSHCSGLSLQHLYQLDKVNAIFFSSVEPQITHLYQTVHRERLCYKTNGLWIKSTCFTYMQHKVYLYKIFYQSGSMHTWATQALRYNIINKSSSMSRLQFSSLRVVPAWSACERSPDRTGCL